MVKVVNAGWSPDKDIVAAGCIPGEIKNFKAGGIPDRDFGKKKNEPLAENDGWKQKCRD